MDPLTHALSGAVLGMFSRERNLPTLGDEEALRTGRGISLTVLAASVLPDVDIVARLWGPFTYFKYHRGPTHSLLGAVLLSALLALLMVRFFPGVKKRRLFLWALLGNATHIFLDLLTSYSTFIFLPFSRVPYFWGILRFGDFVGWYVFGAAVFLSFVLRRVERVRARRGSETRFALLRPAYLAGAAVLLFGGYIGNKAWVKYDLSSVVAGHYAAAAPERIVLTANSDGPSDWSYVVRSAGAFYLGSISRSGGTARETARFGRDADSVVVSSAMKSEFARAAVAFSPLLHIRTKKNGAGTMVTFADLRYGPAPRIRAKVLVDDRGEILEETYLGFGSRVSR